MAYTTEWFEYGVVWTFTDFVDYEQLASAMSQMYGSPRFDELRYFVINTLNVTTAQFSSKEIDMRAAISNVSSTYKKSLKGVFIASHGDIKGIVRRFVDKSQERGSSWDFYLVETERDASVIVKDAVVKTFVPA